MYKLLMLVTLLPSLALANAAEDLVAKLQGLESLRGGFEQTVLDQDGRGVPGALVTWFHDNLLSFLQEFNDGSDMCVISTLVSPMSSLTVTP